MGLDMITERLRSDLNAGAYLNKAYSAVQALRRSAEMQLPEDIEWLAPLVEKYKDDLPGLRRYVFDMLVARGEYRTRLDGAGDHKILRSLYRLLYQTTLMAERRERVNKAIEIYRRRGHTLTNAKRALLTSKQIENWAAQREAYFKQVREANGGELSWFDRCAAGEKFWAAIDAALDKQLNETQAG